MESRISKRALNKLTDLKIRSFVTKARAGKAQSKKLSDGGALYMMLTPAGTPVWRMKYRFVGRERVYAIGTFPEVSLEEARKARLMVRKLLKEGRDPVQARRLDQAEGAEDAGNTFETVANDWLAKQKKDWSAVHYEKSSRAIERDVLPRLGALPVKAVTPAMVASVIEAIVKRGARDTAVKVLQHVGGIFRLAQARGLRDDNPADPVHEVLPGKGKRERIPALLKFPALGELLRNAAAANLSSAVYRAHRLCAFTAARIANVVSAEWAEFNLDADVPTWTIPRAKMKARDRDHDHMIVLPGVLVKELRTWRDENPGRRYLFPSPVDPKAHITRESIEKAYRKTLRYADKHSPHGWRAAFSTLARDAVDDNGKPRFERDTVEIVLDHIHDNDVVRAYDRGERLQQRVRLARWWGEQLAQAQRGADVLPLGRAGGAA